MGHREPCLSVSLPSAEGQLEKEAMFHNTSGAYWALMPRTASKKFDWDGDHSLPPEEKIEDARKVYTSMPQTF